MRAARRGLSRRLRSKGGRGAGSSARSVGAKWGFFAYAPGEFSQHDFGHVDVTFVDGRKKRVHFFASRLKYSPRARRR
jgi:hypothetical protein